MAKFNKRVARTAAQKRRVTEHPDATRNEAGGLAFCVDAKTRLYKAVVTSLVGEDRFYMSGRKHDQMIRQDIHTVAQEDPEWILRLAAYARNEMYLRSVGVALLVEASKIPECRPFVARWTPHILKRADEPKEALAYALNVFGKPIHIGLRRGIAQAMLGFDEYQLIKYDSRGKAGDVTLSDVLSLCRPRPTNASQEALFGYIKGKEVAADLIPKVVAKREFDALDAWGPEAVRLLKDGHVTWEVAITKFGNRKEVWEALQLPYMAALRNLRNMADAGADLKPVLDMLRDPERVRRSKQMPFRFWSALKAVTGGSYGRHPIRSLYYDRDYDPFAAKGRDPFTIKPIKAALSEALEHSVANIPELPGRTLILVDVSGSMDQTVSKRSDITCAEIAAVFGAAVARRMQNTLVAAFSGDYKFLDVSHMPIVDGVRHILKATDHNATYPHKVIEHLIRARSHVDRIIVLSDLQCYTDSVFGSPVLATVLPEYRARVNSAVKVISIDLQGYPTAALPSDEPNVALLAGWSERLFDFIEAFEQGEATADTLISRYEPPPRRRPYWASLEPPRRRKYGQKHHVAPTSERPTPANGKGPYSLDAIADACGVLRSTVQKWVRNGKLTGVKRDGEITVSRTALARFVKESPRYKEKVKQLASFA